MNLKDLTKPFPATDIEWRIQSAGKSGDRVWARVLAYVTNRAIMQRLDDVCGPENWKNEFVLTPKGTLCGLSIKCDGEWVAKWDGADETDIEKFKGGLSGAMKRAAVQWGIGRYLYNLEADYAVISPTGKHFQKGKSGEYDNFKWDPPALPEWALPEGESIPIDEQIAKCVDIASLMKLWNILSANDQGKFKEAFSNKRIELKEDV